jgi:ABC-type dipeptide/oligopeptide/nickel transport system ATPase subunit
MQQCGQTFTQIAKNQSTLEIRRGEVVFPIKNSLFRKKIPPIRVFSDVSFALMCGECVGIIGDSGCGKTTCLRCLCRLQKLSFGEVFLDGQPIWDIPRTQFCRRVQIVFQCSCHALNPLHNVQTILNEPLQLHFKKMNQLQRIERITSLLSAVQLDNNLLKRMPHELSGGQRQRIAIARSLAVDPDFLLCDEIVSALDAVVQREILTLIENLRQTRNIGVLFVSHNNSAVASLCDKVYNFSTPLEKLP